MGSRHALAGFSPAAWHSSLRPQGIIFSARTSQALEKLNQSIYQLPPWPLYPCRRGWFRCLVLELVWLLGIIHLLGDCILPAGADAPPFPCEDDESRKAQ